MNRGIWIACVVCGVVCATARSDDPKPRTAPKPPWQRLLTGDDDKKAGGLEKRIEELEAADKYAEAIRLGEELLALRTKVQGADHWETVNRKWALAALKKVAALPEAQRIGWRQAKQGDTEASRLRQKAQYVKALPLRQERLKWCRQVLGEDHPDTATSCAGKPFDGHENIFQRRLPRGDVRQDRNKHGIAEEVKGPAGDDHHEG
jgi:hypothetical protein